MFNSCEISRSNSSHIVLFIIFSYFLITNPNLIYSITQKNRYFTSRKLKMASFLKQYVVRIAQASSSSLYPDSCQVKCAMLAAQAFITMCTSSLHSPKEPIANSLTFPYVIKCASHGQKILF
jgi:hypothetical protein